MTFDEFQAHVFDFVKDAEENTGVPLDAEEVLRDLLDRGEEPWLSSHG